ncbi:MAG: thioredoxin [Halieaceae bacterium]|nr:thioredoxin [Halieaceae bacterium]
MSSRRRVPLRSYWLMLVIIAGCQNDAAVLPDAGEWRVVNYWAIWCAPCRAEIPELNAVHRETALRVLGVNFEGQTDELLASQAAELGITFPLLEEDPGPSLGQARPRVLPTTWLVNPQGVVTDTLVGPQTRESILSTWEARRVQPHTSIAPDQEI